MSEYETLIIDLQELPDYNFIQFLRVEILNIKALGPTFLGRVRYARNGIEQEEGLPMDLSKGIFIATLRDDQLHGIPRDELEKTLQAAAVEITKIVRKDPNLVRSIPYYKNLNNYENCSTEIYDETSVSILKDILQKDYPYLRYDEDHSEPPDILRCQVINSQTPRHVEDIFKIVSKLSASIGDTFSVGSYGGSSRDGENLDRIWTTFSIR